MVKRLQLIGLSEMERNGRRLLVVGRGTAACCGGCSVENGIPRIPESFVN